MKEFLVRLQERIDVGIVSGSDLVKQEEQLSKESIHFDRLLIVVTQNVTYSFSQNGLVALHKGKKFAQTVYLIQLLIIYSLLQMYILTRN